MSKDYRQINSSDAAKDRIRNRFHNQFFIYLQIVTLSQFIVSQIAK